jgi:hypothetical protein
VSYISVFPPNDGTVVVDVLSAGRVAMRVALREGHFTVHADSMDALHIFLHKAQLAACDATARELREANDRRLEES